MNYKYLASKFDKTHTINRRILAELLSEFPTNSSINVLDFGCGSGNYIRGIKKYSNYSIYGVEPCIEMLEIAKGKNPSVELKRGNHSNIPFPDSFFDFVYMTNVVHQINDIDTMYKEIGRVLKKDGMLCICTENKIQLLGKYWIRYFPAIAIKDLQRFPSIYYLKKLARKNSLLTIKVTQVIEKKRTYVSDFLMRQILERSMSVLNLISDSQYNRGTQKMLVAKKCHRRHYNYRGYTFLWLRKR